MEIFMMKQKAQTKSVKKIFSSVKRPNDTTIIKKHIISLDNQAIKAALMASGMYDNNMKLTASFR